MRPRLLAARSLRTARPPTQASAKTRVGIKQVFEELVSKIVDNPLLASNADDSRPSGLVEGLGDPPAAQRSRGICC
jgi:hypothetical protein